MSSTAAAAAHTCCSTGTLEAAGEACTGGGGGCCIPACMLPATHPRRGLCCAGLQQGPRQATSLWPMRPAPCQPPHLAAASPAWPGPQTGPSRTASSGPAGAWSRPPCPPAPARCAAARPGPAHTRGAVKPCCMPRGRPRLGLRCLAGLLRAVLCSSRPLACCHQREAQCCAQPAAAGQPGADWRAARQLQLLLSPLNLSRGLRHACWPFT